MPRSYPYLAIAAVVVAYVLIATAVLMSPWFNWYNNALSDLGNSAAQRNIVSGADWVFNTGLIMAGALTTVFGVQLSRESEFSWKYLIWTIPLTIASVDLSLIGVFNESFGSIHLIVSVIFFFFSALTLFLYSYLSFPMGTPRTGAIALVLGILCAAVWVVKWPWSGVAIQETVTSAASAALVILVSMRIIRNPEAVHR
ncbi:MAG: DUF998 domain-containing protein [Nitrososphaerota archaeon]|nr:DUF998 domain-containing protein [Nitrososphaerota archaeon]